MQPLLPETFTIPLGRAGKYGTLEVDALKFNADVNRYLYEYGLRQVLNDAMATKVDEDGNALTSADIIGKAVKRLENLYNGTLRSRSAGDAEPIDPFDAECYRIVISDMQQILRLGLKFQGLPKGTKDKLMFVVNRDRAAAGKEEIDRAELVKLYMTGKNGKATEKRAKEALAARSTFIDQDLLSEFT